MFRDWAKCLTTIDMPKTDMESGLLNVTICSGKMSKDKQMVQCTEVTPAAGPASNANAIIHAELSNKQMYITLSCTSNACVPPVDLWYRLVVCSHVN